MDYRLDDFVKDLRSAISAPLAEAAVLDQVKPLVERLARSRSWLKPEHYECDPEQGFGVHILHEDSDHSLWVVAVAWLPKRGAPPHNHGTWAVVAGIDGEEKNVLWRRRGGQLERQGSEVLGPGQVAAFLGNAIHSVANEGDRTTLSLHVYGRNLNLVAERSRFDPETGAEAPFKLRVQ
jgi:predicted metal-dependent enzyme (double-stranded beta helix superfamily)